jgi:hemin uptake protein HemP
MRTPPSPNTAAKTLQAKATPAVPMRVESSALMGGQRVLEIVHLGEVYRLQTTRFGKLILTK